MHTHTVYKYLLLAITFPGSQPPRLLSKAPQVSKVSAVQHYVHKRTLIFATASTQPKSLIELNGVLQQTKELGFELCDIYMLKTSTTLRVIVQWDYKLTLSSVVLKFK